MADSLDEMGELLQLVEQSWKVRALEAENALEEANRQIERLRLEILELFGQMKELRSGIEQVRKALRNDRDLPGEPWRIPGDPHEDGYYHDAQKRRWEQMIHEKYLTAEKYHQAGTVDWMKYIREGDS